MIIVNGLKPLTILTKRSILDVAAALNSPLRAVFSVYIIIHLHVCASVELLYASLWTGFTDEIPLVGAAVYCKTNFCTCIFKGAVMQIKLL